MEPATTFDDLAICQKPNPGARLRLCCFPYAGAGAWAFNSWVDRLPRDIQRDIELWAINYPGHHPAPRDSLFMGLAPLLDLLTPIIASQVRAPFAFFGHSMGALIGFELARELPAQGLSGPVHLVVSGHRAPQLPDRHAPLRQLPDGQFLTAIGKLRGTPEAVLHDPELMELLLPVLRADLAICETYVYRRRDPLAASITAFGGNDDPRITRAELSGWRQQTSAPFSLHMFPGDHFFIQSAQALVLRILAQDLRKVVRRLPASR